MTSGPTKVPAMTPHDKLRTFRELAGVSQAELAGSLYVDQSMIARLEAGTRGPSFLLALSYDRWSRHVQRTRKIPAASRPTLDDLGELAIAVESRA